MCCQCGSTRAWPLARAHDSGGLDFNPRRQHDHGSPRRHHHRSVGRRHPSARALIPPLQHNGPPAPESWHNLPSNRAVWPPRSSGINSRGTGGALTTLRSGIRGPFLSGTSYPESRSRYHETCFLMPWHASGIVATPNPGYRGPGFGDSFSISRCPVPQPCKAGKSGPARAPFGDSGTGFESWAAASPLRARYPEAGAGRLSPFFSFRGLGPESDAALWRHISLLPTAKLFDRPVLELCEIAYPRGFLL